MTTTALASQIATLLEKMSSPDKDYRFMATNDLMCELQKESIALDDDMEKKIIKMLLQLLDDKNGEVQNLAVRCLAPLVHKIKAPQLDNVIDSLCANMESTASEKLRDVSSMALRTVMAELQPRAHSSSLECVKKVMPKLTDALSAPDTRIEPSVKLEVLDIIGTLVQRFGHAFTFNFEAVEEAVFAQLSKERQALRKRAIHTLSHLVDVVTNQHFDKIATRVLKGCEEANKKNNVNAMKTYVGAATAMCRSSPTRFARHLPAFIPLLVQPIKETEDDELKEACLQAFEAFLQRCTKAIGPQLPQLVELIAEQLKYDPNYHYDEDEEEANGDAAAGSDIDVDEKSLNDEDDSEEEDEEEDYSDDDDLSWKVRRAAAKCIEAMVIYQPSRLADNLQRLGPLLIARMKEREENVRHDIYNAYVALLKQCASVTPTAASIQQKSQQQQQATGAATVEPTQPQTLLTAPAFSRAAFRQFVGEELTAEQQRAFAQLEGQVPTLVRALQPHLRGRKKGLKSSQQCFVLLTHLVRALPGSLATSFRQMIQPLEATLGDKSADGNMKITALHFLDVALRSHEPRELYPYVGTLTPMVVRCVEDSFYKVTSEALNVVQAMSLMLRPSTQAEDEEAKKAAKCAEGIQKLYTAIVAKMGIADIDQEVKEKTIASLGIHVALFGNQAGIDLKKSLPLLPDRLRNEMLRLVTVRAITTIVQSPIQPPVDLSAQLSEVLPLLADFLRKNQRSLRLATLTLLDALVGHYPQGLPAEGLVKVVKEVPSLISDQDLQISQLAMRFVTDVISAYPVTVAESLEALLDELTKLTQSPLLQGATLQAALQLIAAVVQSKQLANKPTFEQLNQRLSEPAYASKGELTHRQVYSSIAKAVAVVAVTTGNERKANSLLEELRKTVTNEKDGNSARLFAVLALGELGRLYPGIYATSVGAKVQPEQLITQCFAATLDELKTAASYALGALTVGNLEKYLPYLLAEIQQADSDKRQYLLLQALKEVISSESGSTSQFDFTIAAATTNGARQGRKSPQQGRQSPQQVKRRKEMNSVFGRELPTIWAVLRQHCNATDEGIRTIVAECMGKMCLVAPDTYLPELLNCARDNSPMARCTAVTAVRFMVFEHPHPIDEQLRPMMGSFLKAGISDADLLVVRAAIVTLNSTAHNKPRLVKDCLDALEAPLYAETNVRKDLVREVEMGPFKHIVDDGLDLRKAAFECLYTLGDRCLDRIDLFDYMTYMENGLKDQHDIMLLTFLMLVRLANKCPLQLAQRVDRFAELIKPQLLLRPKPNAVKQENEKQEELKRAAVRTVLVMRARVPSQDRANKMADLLELIRGDPALAALLDQCEKEIRGGRLASSNAIDNIMLGPVGGGIPMETE